MKAFENVGLRLNRSFRHGFFALLFNFVLPGAALSQICDLHITKAGPCLAYGKSGSPSVGDVYGLTVIFNIIGHPAQPFRIKWTMANVTNYYDNINQGPGNGYSWNFTRQLDLDDPIPWSITLDPDGVSGDTNLLNNGASGTFTPIPPATAMELYSPHTMTACKANTLNFPTGGKQTKRKNNFADSPAAQKKTADNE